MSFSTGMPVVLAAATHPDDIEFMFAGTLLLLKEAGCEIHLWNLANGCCGSRQYSKNETSRIRLEEAKESAALAGATYHSPVFNDLEIFYDKPSLATVTDVVRSIRPQIILTHSPDDYMEDHQNVCRLIVTAAFSRGMVNFGTPDSSYDSPVRIYHAAPHGLCDGLGNAFRPDLLVDIATVLDIKCKMLACHRSQQDWLVASQGLGAYVEDMMEMASTMGGLTSPATYAEGWRRHAHLGFCPPDFDPLPEILQIFSRVFKHSAAALYAKTHQ
ncbi:MAG: PIG-L family deacetylase [Chthoniobacterales bacterium]